MKGIIVLEGADGAGKTTLAHRLIDAAKQKLKPGQPEPELLHMTWSKKLAGVMSEYMIGMLAHADELAKDRLVIIDRQCITAYVYQNTFRNDKNMADPGLYSQFMHYCPNASIIFCLPTFDVWKQNFIDMCMTREEMYGLDKLDQMVSVYQQYEEIARGTDKPKWYPDNLLMDHIIDGGVLNHKENSAVYDFDKLSDKSGVSWADGFLLTHMLHNK